MIKKTQPGALEMLATQEALLVEVVFEAPPTRLEAFQEVRQQHLRAAVTAQAPAQAHPLAFKFLSEGLAPEILVREESVEQCQFLDVGARGLGHAENALDGAVREVAAVVLDARQALLGNG